LNGIPAFFVTIVSALVVHFSGLFRLGAIYDNYGELLTTMQWLAFVFCIVLYFKGHYWPSSSEVHFSGNPIFDFFQGVELYPTVFGISLKQWINCRVAMMNWALVPIVCCFKQFELYGYISLSMAVSAALVVTYCFKFFVWEGGYFKTIDIMHDRFGYYICWGITTWVPTVYVAQSIFLVAHPFDLGWFYAALLFVVGAAVIYLQYDIDLNRQIFRDTEGRCLIWGEKPRYIDAYYTTLDGTRHRSMLLVSGGWEVARHWNYTLELTMTFCWTAAAKFSHLLPWGYFIFLTILLVDRATRDDRRCAHKYGHYWKDYCEAVPYSLIPGIY
jgi:7-dehydrocholesterol reductase